MKRRDYIKQAVVAVGAVGLSGCTFTVDSAGSANTTTGSPTSATTSARSQTPREPQTTSATPTGGPEVNQGTTTQAQQDLSTPTRTSTRTATQTQTSVQARTPTQTSTRTATRTQTPTGTVESNTANELVIEYIEEGTEEGTYTVYFSSSAIEYGSEADQEDNTDTITGSRASGSINSGADNYYFEGQLTQIDYGGNLRFIVNGNVVESNPPTATATETETSTSTDQPTIDAQIESFDPETGAFSPGDVQNATVTVTNTGNTTNEFYVGYSARDPSGEGIPPPSGPPASITLTPDQTGEVTVDWPVTDDVPTGTYGAFTTVRETWSESEGYGGVLDSAEESDVFEIVSDRR